MDGNTWVAEDGELKVFAEGDCTPRLWRKFKHVEVTYEPDGTPDETLNQLGAEGWELVSVVDTGTVETDTGFNYFAFMFKRPKVTPMCDSTKLGD